MCVRRALGQTHLVRDGLRLLLEDRHHLAGAFIALLLTCLGFVVLIIPGIYLSSAYPDDVKLIGDQPTSPPGPPSRRRARPSTTSGGAFLGLNLVVDCCDGCRRWASHPPHLDGSRGR
jgi:hypothetical protein